MLYEGPNEIDDIDEDFDDDMPIDFEDSAADWVDEIDAHDVFDIEYDH